MFKLARLSGVVAILLSGLVVGSPTFGAAGLPQDVLDTALRACIENRNAVWATPGSASRLCPCFIENIKRMPLTNSQKIRVMLFNFDEEMMQPFVRPLSTEDRAVAFRYSLTIQEGCHV
ncbi:hypothetical protein [uncultured Devosia sp.]|uniref:hypothetical protein n=1 Tax=uncultured Devosia sp. TaxID=211434 RepID=UPI002607A15F|nr:hypothetical protein [uncultured Devosia sp.]